MLLAKRADIFAFGLALGNDYYLHINLHYDLKMTGEYYCTALGTRSLLINMEELSRK